MAVGRPMVGPEGITASHHTLSVTEAEAGRSRAGLGRTAELPGWDCGQQEGQRCWGQGLGKGEASCLSLLFPPLSESPLYLAFCAGKCQ